jgi:hypothetical protein
LALRGKGAFEVSAAIRGELTNKPTPRAIVRPIACGVFMKSPSIDIGGSFMDPFVLLKQTF